MTTLLLADCLVGDLSSSVGDNLECRMQDRKRDCTFRDWIMWDCLEPNGRYDGSLMSSSSEDRATRRALLERDPQLK